MVFVFKRAQRVEEAGTDSVEPISRAELKHKTRNNLIVGGSVTDGGGELWSRDGTEERMLGVREWKGGQRGWEI